MGEIQGTVLVTGGSGFLGRRLTGRLVAGGHRVRVLARKTSNIGQLTAMEVEIVVGDLADKSSLNDAFRGVGVVVHAAAGT
ncbi:MAG: NAD-dependent epimerase/dehydratase family protein, partial [Nitrososphaeraceae archaeon]